MSNIFGSVWWFLVTLGILVTFHEFGHFWVARRFGVRVLRFSIGFGKPLWSRKGRDGVEYAIGSIPLGGYVKFLDAREADNPEYVAQQPGEYNAAPVWQRMAIAAAGPVFNIIFTIVAFWAMFVLGRPDFPPLLAEPSGMAAQAGFANGDRIVAVDGERVDSYSGALLAIEEQAILHSDTVVDVVDTKGRNQRHTLTLSKLPAGAADNEKTFEAIGLLPMPQEAIAGDVPNGPAARAGLRSGDRVVRINDVAVASFTDLIKAIPAEADKNPLLHVLIDRAGAQSTLDIIAEQQKNDDNKLVWRIGIGQADGRTAIERYDPLHAVPAAFRETWKTTVSTTGMIYNMLTGKVSLKNVHSAISIAEVANASAHMGLAWFLSFLALVSLSLGILNLLPIPILDGGHLLYYLIELVKGRPLSERTLIAGQYVGLALLMALMSVAFYNDILGKFAG
jgi:regulator of sigma E protease